MKKLTLIICLLLALLTFGVLSIGINKPFTGHHDDNDSYFAQVGRNYLHYGIFPLHFGQLIGNSTPESKNFYTHHPPLLSLSLAASLAVFGDTYYAVRLVPIFFSVATVIMFFLLLRRFFDPVTSLLSVVFFIITPMFMFFGKMADHEVPTLFFIILAVYLYSRWQQTKKRKNFNFLLLVIFIGQWFGWPAYYLAGLLFLLTRRWEILILSLADFALFLGGVYWQTGSLVGGGLDQIFVFRTGFGQLPWVTESYTNIQLATQEVQWLYHFFTPPQVIAGTIALIVSIYLWVKGRKITSQNLLWLIFLAIAVIHVILFRTGAWRHDYWLYYFLPFFAWGIASGISLATKYFPRQRSKIVLGYLILLVVALIQSQPFFWALQNIVVK